MPPPESPVRALLRPLLSHRRLVPAVALALRARTVRPGWRFALRELLGRRGLVLYRVRTGGLAVGVRHGTGDVVTLGEVFHERDYAPPPEVASALAAVERPRILDLGANVGMFGVDAAQRWPRATITGYEPDPDNADVHRRVIEANGLGDRWTVVEAAAGADDGEATFAAGLAALSRMADGCDARGGRLVTVRVADVLADVAAADLVKIDIEGGEWPVLADPRFAAAPPRTLAMEYHPEGCPASDARGEAERLLGAAGMRTAIVWERDRYGMLWAWRS